MRISDWSSDVCSSDLDDLDRIILARKCGDEFVKRRDAFLRAYASQCRVGGGKVAVDACALSLGDEYGFPDARCTADGPPAKLRTAGGISASAAHTAPPATPRDAPPPPPPAHSGRGG